MTILHAYEIMGTSATSLWLLYVCILTVVNWCDYPLDSIRLLGLLILSHK